MENQEQVAELEKLNANELVKKKLLAIENLDKAVKGLSSRDVNSQKARKLMEKDAEKVVEVLKGLLTIEDVLKKKDF